MLGCFTAMHLKRARLFRGNGAEPHAIDRPCVLVLMRRLSPPAPADSHDAHRPMKPAPFEYARPATLDQACDLLIVDGATIIAGGQTLVPMMAMRLARPSLLVDIARIPELAFVRDEGDA